MIEKGTSGTDVVLDTPYTRNVSPCAMYVGPLCRAKFVQPANLPRTRIPRIAPGPSLKLWNGS